MSPRGNAARGPAGTRRRTANGNRQALLRLARDGTAGRARTRHGTAGTAYGPGTGQPDLRAGVARALLAEQPCPDQGGGRGNCLAAREFPGDDPGQAAKHGEVLPDRHLRRLIRNRPGGSAGRPEHDLRPPAGQLADPGGQQAELTAELGLGDISRPSQARDVAVPDNQAHQLRHPVRGSLPEESTASTMNTRPCGPGGRHSPRT